MNRRARSAARGLGVFGIGAALSWLGTYPLFLRRWCLTWGARPDEVSRELPGDELLADAGIVATRAITIGAPPAAVWPWPARLFSMLVMEPGSLVMERKMLLGIKERAEELARGRAA
jgi:hypothetical protein